MDLVARNNRSSGADRFRWYEFVAVKKTNLQTVSISCMTDLLVVILI